MQMRFSFLEGGAEYFFLSLGCHHGCQQTVSIPEIVQVCMSTCIRRDEKILCLWLGEVCYCCSLTILPYPAWVLVLVLFVNKISPVYSQQSNAFVRLESRSINQCLHIMRLLLLCSQMFVKNNPTYRESAIGNFAFMLSWTKIRQHGFPIC